MLRTNGRNVTGCPCHRCGDRERLCWNTCARYGEWKSEYNKKKAEATKSMIARDYLSDSAEAMQRRLRMNGRK